jgi:hypothetical protein
MTIGTEHDPTLDLISQLDRMGPALRGRFVPAAATAGHEVQPVSGYLDLTHLERQILRTVPESDQDVVDRRAAASRFVRDWATGVVPVIVVGLAMGIGIDASLDRAQSVWKRWSLRGSSGFAPHALSVGDDALSVCGECHPTVRGVTVVSTHAELRQRVWRKLFAEHLAPLFDAVLQVIKLSRRVLWGSAAEGAGRAATFAAEQLSPDDARPFIEECDALLAADRLPGLPAPNPLSDEIHWKDIGRSDFPHGLMLRSVCCTVWTLPDRRGQLYCGTCPLPPVETLVSILGRPAADPRSPA